MKLVNEYDPILNKECQLFDFENPIVDPKELADSLQRVRKLGKGVGLAAPQVGIDTKVLVIGMSDFETEGTEDFEKAFFNPKIKKYEGEPVYSEEGCLSFPGLFMKVKRPTEIVMNWQDEEVKHFSETIGGMTSRILQHEVDHLEGITFLKRADKYHLDKARRNLKKYYRYKKRLTNGRG